MPTFDEIDAETPDEREARLHDLSRERPTSERTKRSDALEEMRSDRANAIEDTRIVRAEALAVTNAKRHWQVDMRLDQHEQRLNAINGSVARGAAATESVHQSLASIRDDLKQRDAVNVALIEANASKGAKRLTAFQQGGIVLMGLLASGSLLVAILQAAGHS